MTEFVITYPFAVDNPLVLPLILKKKPDYLKGLLNLPGGKLEEGETALQAGIRELKEETGLDELQEYDGMCYYPAEYMGVIEGYLYTIHCIKVPVCSRQQLIQEDEEIKWYNFPELLALPNLIPNLRLVIPLIYKNIRDWKVVDTVDWAKKNTHSVMFSFSGIDFPLEVVVNP